MTVLISQEYLKKKKLGNTGVRSCRSAVPSSPADTRIEPNVYIAQGTENDRSVLIVPIYCSSIIAGSSQEYLQSAEAKLIHRNTRVPI